LGRKKLLIWILFGEEEALDMDSVWGERSFRYGFCLERKKL